MTADPPASGRAPQPLDPWGPPGASWAAPSVGWAPPTAGWAPPTAGWAPPSPPSPPAEPSAPTPPSPSSPLAEPSAPTPPSPPSPPAEPSAPPPPSPSSPLAEPSAPTLADPAPAPAAADLTWRTAEPDWDRPDPRTKVGGGRATKPRARTPRRSRPRSLPRALGCATASALVPGLGQALQRRWRAALLFGLPTVAVLGFVAWAIGHDRATLVDWTVDARVLRGLGIGGVIWALLCYTAASEAAIAAWPTTFTRRSSRHDRHRVGHRGHGRRARPRHRGLVGGDTAGQPSRHGVRGLGRREGGRTQPARRPRHHRSPGDPRHDFSHLRRHHGRDDHTDDHTDDGAALDRPRDRRRASPRRPLEHRAARRRCRTAPMGPADGHHDRGQHRSPDRRPGQHLGAPEPATPPHAQGRAPSTLPFRVQRSRQCRVPLRRHPPRPPPRPGGGDQGRAGRAPRHPHRQLRPRRPPGLHQDHRRARVVSP